jgi:heptosyltransferase-2
MKFYTPKIIASNNHKHHGLLENRSPNAVVVRATNWLGDNLMSMPAIYRLRQALPGNCKLHVVCKKSLAPLWKTAGWIDSLVPFDGKRLRGADKEKIRVLHADAALILPNSFGAALDMFNCSIPVRVGRAGRGRSLFLTHRLPRWRSEWKSAEFHQVTHYFDLAQTLVPVQRTLPDQPLLKIPNTEALTEKLGIDSDIENTLAIAPGAAYGPAKQWPVESFAKTVDNWVENGGHAIVIGTEKERELGEKIRDHTPEYVHNLCGKTSLPELMAVLKSCSACVCNDSGVMHLAAALGTPGVAVFGSTNPAATGPLGARWIVMANSTNCDPCFQRTCAKNANNAYTCLRCTTPDAVSEALQQITGAGSPLPYPRRVSRS